MTLISKSAESSSSSGVAAQQGEIALGGLERRHGHATLDPALECAMLVESEIVNRLRPQQIYDLGQQIRNRIFRGRLSRRRRDSFAALALDQRGRDLRAVSM